MKEIIHSYGKDNNLSGIATIPDDINKKAAVILFNAGVLHKVNAFDMNIDVMKTLSDDGAFVFRFDLSGMGDSFKSSQNLKQEDQIINDFKETMDLIEDQYDIHEFVFFGLCTGADHSHKIAAKDERVMGVVWLDGYGYPTSKFKKLNALRYLKAAMNPKKLTRFIKKKLLGGNQGDFDHPAEDVSDVYVWELPDKEKYRSEMKEIFKRGCQCLYLYSGGVNDYYLYENQFYDSFSDEDFISNIDVAYYREADHLYVIKKHRHKMLKKLTQWLNEKFSI